LLVRDQHHHDFYAMFSYRNKNSLLKVNGDHMRYYC